MSYPVRIAAVVLAVTCCAVAPAAADDSETCKEANGEGAIAACSNLLSRNPKDIYAYNRRGLAYNSVGAYDRAIRDYDQVIVLDPNASPAYSNRGWAYLSKREYDRAIADTSKAITLDPKNAQAYFGRALAYFHGKRDDDSAIADLTQAITLDPNVTLFYDARGLAYYRKRDYDRAIVDFNKLITIDPKNAQSYLQRGRAYIGKGSYDDAIADFNQAIGLDPKPASAYFYRGVAHKGRQDYDRAISDFNSAIERNLRDAETYSQRGFAYYMKREYDRAITDYNQAIELDPKFGHGYFLRGSLYLYGKSDYDAAIDDLNKAITLDSASAYRVFLSDAYYYRGGTYYGKGDYGRALADYDQAIKINPRMEPRARQNRERAQAALATQQAQSKPSTTQQSQPTPSLTATERRVALIIGNGAYPGAARLGNPVNDADDVSAALRAVGFDVTEGKDLTLAGISEIIETFRDKARGADVALFYYSGHGMQFDEQNWLMPVDARVTTAFDARHSNMSLQEMIAEFETSARTTLVFLDACRNNPLADELRQRLKSQNRAVGDARGLRPIEIKAPQTMVVFATRPNATAADGIGRNSPFTEAFLQHIKTPGVEIEALMKRVSQTVSQKTSGRQQPERLSRLEHEFYFVASR